MWSEKEGRNDKGKQEEVAKGGRVGERINHSPYARPFVLGDHFPKQP